MDALLLSRIQFAFVISFHVLFQAFTIGLASWLAFLGVPMAMDNAGLLLGMWPYLVPPVLTLWDAAAPPSSQSFLLVGVLVLLPLILGYTAWSYRVFRGKVRSAQGYH